LEHRASNPVSVKTFNRYRNLNNCKVVEALCSSGNEEEEEEEEVVEDTCSIHLLILLE
jgi:hypothetical protein